MINRIFMNKYLGIEDSSSGMQPAIEPRRADAFLQSRAPTPADTPKASESKAPAPVTETGDASYAHSATYRSYGVRNGGRQAWRLPHEGSHYGKSAKIVFADGTVFNISDTSKNHRDRDGRVFKPGHDSGYTDKARDTSTSDGHVYVHAPYGNKSQSFTIYWN